MIHTIEHRVLVDAASDQRITDFFLQLIRELSTKQQFEDMAFDPEGAFFNEDVSLQVVEDRFRSYSLNLICSPSEDRFGAVGVHMRTAQAIVICAADEQELNALLLQRSIKHPNYEKLSRVHHQVGNSPLTAIANLTELFFRCAPTPAVRLLWTPTGS